MNELHDDNTTNFVRKQGIQSIKFKMWVELSSNFCHLSDIIRPLLRTNLLYEKPTVVFLPQMPCGPAGVWGSHASHSRITLTALRAFRKHPKTTVLQSTHWKIIALICCAQKKSPYNRISWHCGMKTSTVTPSFYYIFNISLSCNNSMPSFLGNLWWVLFTGESP